MAISKDIFDLRLTVDSVEYGFFLAEQDGVKQLNDGFAPLLAQQIRTDAFGYEHIPPEIEVPQVAETWVGGCGYELASEGGTTSTTVYNYSRGLDLSNPGRIHISPKQQTALTSTGAAIAAAPTKFVDTTLGLFMLAGTYIYEYDNGTNTTSKWIERDDASGDGVNYKDLVELNGTLYASRGSGADYKYSTDGITWTAFTDSDENVDYFTVRGNGSDVAAVWKVLTNAIKNTTNGANGGVAWSGSDQVGHSTETNTGIITVDNDIYVFKKEGIYQYNGSSTVDLWKTTYYDSNNGRTPYLWSNGKMYAPYGHRLLEIDTFAYGTTTLSPVYPAESMDSLEVQGDITAVSGDQYWLYLAVKNYAGNTYIIKGRPGDGWHTYLYLGANDCNAISVIAAGGNADTTNPLLFIGYGTAAPYYILPRDGLQPSDDPKYEYSLSEGTVHGPYLNFGAKTYEKFLNRGSVLGDRISAGRPVTLSYEIDRSGTTTTLVSATTSGVTDTDESSEVVFNQLRYKLTMQTGDSAAGPVVDSIALFATLNPPRKRMWQPIVILSDQLTGRGGVSQTQQPASHKMREILFSAIRKRVTLTDEDTHTHVVRLLDIVPTGRVYKQIGGKEHVGMGYQLKMVEIASSELNGTEAIYDSSTYDSGAVYS